MRGDVCAASGLPALPFGAFYGVFDRRIHAPGMEIAMLTADPHRVVERHSHDEAHFVLILDGLYISSAAEAEPVSAGPVLIFNPAGTTHRDRFEARDRVMGGRFLTLSIAADLMDGAHFDAGVASRAIALRHHRALALGARLVAESVATGTDATLQRESIALSLLTEVATARSTASRQAPAWLGRARELLDDALSTTVTIGDIAREAGVHPVHLARVFREATGMSPADYLRRRRLAHASTLLRETRRPMAEIAQACGFVDQSHFTTAFRRAYGATPRVYRQR